MQVAKDDRRERPIPDAWRPTLAAIVVSLSATDGSALGGGVEGVQPVSTELSSQCREAVRSYGEGSVISLPKDSWDTSVCLWQGDRWGCLVDLWTTHGRSDLVLDVDVFEDGDGFGYVVNLVYVP